MDRTEKRAPARAAMAPIKAMRALMASTSRRMRTGNAMPEGRVNRECSAPMT